MIREEEQAGAEEDTGGGASAHEAEEHHPGLLSQALRGPSPRTFNRAVSLSNLLDQRPQPVEGPLAGLGSGPASSSGQQQQPQQPAGGSGGGADDGAGGEGGARRRVRSAPQWQHKQTVIEMLNELIDELEGIEAQIAHQAVEHIHANEVRRRGFGVFVARCDLLHRAGLNLILTRRAAGRRLDPTSLGDLDLRHV